MKAGERIVFLVALGGLGALALHQRSEISELRRQVSGPVEVVEMRRVSPRSSGLNTSSSGGGGELPPASEAVHASMPKPAAAAASVPRVWRSIESDDYKTYIRNLRDTGCPEKTIQDIVVADVVQTYKDRRREVLGGLFPEFKYWQASTITPEQKDELWCRQRELNEEMRGVIQDLVGDAFQLPPLDYVWRSEETYQRLGFLPDDRRGEVHEILMRYADVDVEVKQLSDWNHPGADAEELARLWGLYRERNDVLKKVLSPEEYEMMDMSTSWTGENLRKAMVKFNPSEEEFRMIFKAWRAHDEDLARRKAAGEEDPGNDHVYAEIRESMDETRFELYRSTWWKN